MGVKWNGQAAKCSDCGEVFTTRQDAENHDGAHGALSKFDNILSKVAAGVAIAQTVTQAATQLKRKAPTKKKAPAVKAVKSKKKGEN